MKASEMINQIKTLLDIQVKLEERKLENGTVVEAESFEKDREIFIKTDDEKVAMPVGEYILESGELIVVEAEGIIADVRDVSDDVPAKEEESAETEDLEKNDSEIENLEEDDPSRYVTVDDWRGMEERIANLEDAISNLKKDKESNSEKVVEAEEQPKDRQPKSRTVKEEFSDKENNEENLDSELKEELSKPAADPIKHNPESNSDKVEMTRYSEKRRGSVMDNVLDKLINN
jgi:hypothetical protein